MLRNNKGQFTNETRPYARKGEYRKCIMCNKEMYVKRHKLSSQKTCSPDCYHLSTRGKSPINKGDRYGKANWLIRGNPKLYKQIHYQIGKMLGKPSVCSKCLIDDLDSKDYHWANISGNYILDESDWIRLCPTCHKRFDGYGLQDHYRKVTDTEYGRIHDR